MKAIVVDDEKLLLEQFQYECGDIPKLEILGYFSVPLKALEFANVHPLDLAFVDLKMPKMDGLTLAAELRVLYPEIKIIVITAHGTEYDQSALKQMNGMILKPYEREDVEKVLGSIL